MGQTILILGGGVGGLVTAQALRKKLPKAHRVVLVEREAQHLFAPSLLWLMVGAREPDAIRRPYDKLAKKGIEVRRGEIEHIDAQTRQVTVAGETLTADHLVLALGAELAPELIPGLSDAGHDFYTLDGATAFRDRLRTLAGGRVVILTATPAYKCPAAPYEAAMLVDDLCKREGKNASVAIYAAEPGPMGVTGPQVSAAMRQMVEQKGIVYHPEHQVTAAQAGKLTFANGATAEFDLLGYVPPHRAPKVVRESGLCGASGWVEVDRHTLETNFAGVHAIGDVVSIPLKLRKPLPKAGVFAHGQADVVANNIARQILGQGEPERFEGHGECFVETGGGKAGFGTGNFYAEPTPAVTLKEPARRWHLAKVAFEKAWLFTRLSR